MPVVTGGQGPAESTSTTRRTDYVLFQPIREISIQYTGQGPLRGSHPTERPGPQTGPGPPSFEPRVPAHRGPTRSGPVCRPEHLEGGSGATSPGIGEPGSAVTVEMPDETACGDPAAATLQVPDLCRCRGDEVHIHAAGIVGHLSIVDAEGEVSGRETSSSREPLTRI